MVQSYHTASQDDVGRLYIIVTPVIATLFTVVNNAGAKQLPNNVVPSEKHSITGKPDISLTENNEPDKLSVTLNNCPCDPCTESIGVVAPDPCIVTTFVVPETNNLAEDVDDVPIITLPLVVPNNTSPVVF